LLSSNKSINVWLCRCIRYHQLPLNARKSNPTGPEWKEDLELLESAVWWPATGKIGHNTNRKLNGEIRLVKEMKPTTSVAYLTVRVRIAFDGVG
jgi:hypothetical protein